jgi:hypothetical protein
MSAMARKPVYRASQIKRVRATQVEIFERRNALLRIVEEIKPATVRQVFYQATVHEIIEKTEAGYTKVQTDLVWLRRNGHLPYSWLADSTRWQRKPDSFADPATAIAETARLYRKAVWAEADAYVEVWLEKDALAGVILPVTAAWDVPLMVARGYASLTFLHEAATYMATLDVPTYVYQLGDYDPSGVDAARNIDERLREMAPDAEIYFERLAVMPEQIRDLKLPTRPTKTTDSRSKGFGAISVELDAIAPDDLRDLVQDALERHIPREELAVIRTAEESERALLRGLVGILDART